MQYKHLVLATLYINGTKGLNINDFVKEQKDLTLDELFKIIKQINYEFKLTNQCLQINRYDYLFILEVEAKIVKHFENQQAKEKKLSSVTMEILAIISQNPNITRPEINKIRGVNSDVNIKKLIEQRFIRISGKNPQKANSKMLCVDIEFYKYFNIESLNQLPKMDAIELNNIPEEEIEFLSNKFAKEGEIDLKIIKKEVENGKNK